MEQTRRNTFSKHERICSRIDIDALFNKENSRSMTAFPFRLVYLLCQEDAEAFSTDAPVQILVSVPKRCFNRAIKRNRVKRQVREAYRKNKHRLLATIGARPGCRLLLAFIWLDKTLHDSREVEYKVRRLLERVEEKVCTTMNATANTDRHAT